MIELSGITWGHARGSAPLIHTALQYADVAPDVKVTWETRSLQAFADYPIERLAERYDLLIIDHPFVGEAADFGCLHPLEDLIDRAVLDELARNSVGRSHLSYEWAGRQWALAVDAAGHVAASRPDLLRLLGVDVPKHWADVLAMGEACRKANMWLALPTIPIDALMSLFSVMASFGSAPFADAADRIERPAAIEAIRLLRAILAYSHPASPDWNPPAALEAMSEGSEVVYAPLLFGYSNYARPGFRRHLVEFDPSPDGLTPGHGGILGGTGLAISSATRHPEAAAAYAAWVASPEIQSGAYFASGGQPGHRTAWIDPAVNLASSGFFSRTLPGLDASYLRPRWKGYLAFQNAAGPIVRAALLRHLPDHECADRLRQLAEIAERTGRLTDADL